MGQLVSAKFEIDSSLSKWMCFIDGENLTIRSQSFASKTQIIMNEGEYFKNNVFMWLPNTSVINTILHNRGYGSYSRPLRTYYYTSVVGGEDVIQSVKESIWNLGFQPEVFKKNKQQEKAKGVDIALARDFLGNAFRNNYDVAFLFAGDGDYLPLIEEVKRLGKVVCVLFFESEGLSKSPKLAADHFLPIDDVFTNAWAEYNKDEF